ncbi:MAG: aspartate-semialdehyde dehydrogenase [Phycisphaeraceae bacterium]
MTTVRQSSPAAAPAGRPRTSAPNVAVVGATGAVGQEFLKVLAQRDFPIGELRLLASARSAGKTATFRGKDYAIEELTEASFKGVDLALFSAGGSISKKYAQAAVDAGAVVVDNSSAFRMTEGVPLVVPEVNAEAIGEVKVGSKPGIIANPNCSTIIMVVALAPLHRAATVKRVVASTYQAASGAGAAAMAELEQQTRDVLEGRPPTQNVFPFQYAFNVFSHNSEIGENGYNEEEMKMIKETRKIFGDESIRVAVTCVRVPVMRAHAESLNIELERELSEAEAERLLRDAPGVAIINDRKSNTFPTPLDAADKDDVFVGRIRQDISRDDQRGLDLFICADQIRKGAALNAVQIAERVL